MRCRKFGSNKRITNPQTREGLSEFETHTQKATNGKRANTEALEVAVRNAQYLADIRAQHGPCYRIDPITGAKTLIK